MSDYNKFRKVIIDLCKQKGACEEEFRKLVSATDMASFNDVLKANFHWCCNNEVLTGDIIDTYGLAEYGIRHNVDASGGYLLASGSATVLAWGSATVRASGNAAVLAWGSAAVRAWGNAKVRASDSAYIHAPYGAIECKLSGQAILRHNGVIKSATSEMKLP